MIENFTGFWLYDNSFINVLRNLKDPTPFLRGIVAKLSPDRKEIPYEQQKRESGKSNNNFIASMTRQCSFSLLTRKRVYALILSLALFVRR